MNLVIWLLRLLYSSQIATPEVVTSKPTSDNEGGCVAATKTFNPNKVQRSLGVHSTGLQRFEKEFQRLQEGMHMVIEGREDPQSP